MTRSIAALGLAACLVAGVPASLRAQDCCLPAVAETDCSDEIDEDCDGPVDCADTDCAADAACRPPPAPNAVVINEIVATSPGSPDVEYVELRNDGPGTQDLTGWYLLDDDDQHDKCFLDASLAPGEYRVVAGLIAEFSQRYPEAIGQLNANPFDSATGGQGFSLGDGGDHVRLFRPTAEGDELVSGYTFGPQSDEVPFGFRPEGIGNVPEYLAFPTPGSTNDAAPVFSPVCINEFQTTSLAGGIDDWIELYNRGAVPVDIGGWYLSDSAAQPTKYAFASGTTIPPGAFLTVDEATMGFSLSSTGSEVIALTAPDGSTGQDYIDYGPQFPDVTRGRFPDGASTWIFLGSPSRGVANGCRVADLAFVSETDLDWSSAPGATLYDVVRGDLGLLRSNSGDFSLAAVACAANDTGGTSLHDETIVAAGGGLFYLVRAADSDCGAGTWDSASPAQAAGRDAGIAAGAATCP